MRAFLETWRPVRGYEGLYEVSDYGDVRSLRFGKVKYLKKVKNRKDYEQLKLCRYGKSRDYRVHRLVWEAFRGPIPDGYEIDHINTVRDDNRLVNLRVVTSKENNHNPITRERKLEANRRKAKDPKWIEAHREASRDANRRAFAKPVLQLDKDNGEVIREWQCVNDAERELGIHHSNISACCNGKLKTAGGFRWRFK